MARRALAQALPLVAHLANGNLLHVGEQANHTLRHAAVCGLGASHQLQAARGFSEDLRVVTSSLTENDYHRVADATMDSMAEKLEAYVEECDVDGGDVEYSQGVLTVKLGTKGTFVINKQTPNRQIWLSSPVSGPFRFDYEGGRWRYSRDHHDLLLQLQEEIGGLVGRPLQLE
ncbi:hypothetical protein CHLRE_12g538350v5 [Chlamydomonas reinhardtii]|uniref:ferroxidase n=1 Tax=Chlamydomonas reinhardtii TaxID=3055 RepID=A0A2K3D5B5_CHLRE|nr:uncharacterized protein CHLRE_12g538350v5 [Chlamydomonas reinhardtii]PNW75721.1 hypothetical protein CHLRE_12g538350v5 [Chlamydomonas reinhardtii]